jgi:Tfp pilus assembly protein PilN
MPIVNLLPPQLRETQVYAKRNRLIVDSGIRLGAACAIVIAALALQSFILGRSITSTEASVSSQKQTLTAYADLEREASSAEKRLRQLATLRAGHLHWETFLDELAARTPAGVYLTGIASGPSGTGVIITGSARDETQVASFVQALKGWSRLTAVTLQSVSPDSDGVGFAKSAFTVAATPKTGGLK